MQSTLHWLHIAHYSTLVLHCTFIHQYAIYSALALHRTLLYAYSTLHIQQRADFWEFLLAAGRFAWMNGAMIKFRTIQLAAEFTMYKNVWADFSEFLCTGGDRFLLKIIGLFCNRALLKRRYSAKENYILKEPTNRSHFIASWRSKNPENYYRSLLQNIVSLIRLFCKRDL